MKKLMVLVFYCCFQSIVLFGQDIYPTPSMGVISVETRNIDFDPVSLGNILRNELIKLDLFTVVDRYETMQALVESGSKEDNCYGKSCIAKVGQQLGVDKMAGGIVDRYGGHIVVSLRVIDVASGKIEHNHIQEFIDAQENLPKMLELSLQKMYDKEVDKALFSKLTDDDDYDNTINNPDVTRLRLSGPRIGFGLIANGIDRKVLESKGPEGFDAWPVMSQFGYQFEYSYLNQGNVQALFEIVPTIAGIEQKLFIPSLAILHGVRSNVTGLEFAFGPILFVNKQAQGFEHNGTWYLEKDAGNFPGEDLKIEKRLDNRGQHALDAGLIVALGRTFRSGKVNFPVNIVTVLKKSGFRLGLSFGFNASSR